MRKLVIVLLSVKGHDLDRKDAENIQGQTFPSGVVARTQLLEKAFKRDTEVKILTPDEFKGMFFPKLNRAFDRALENQGKKGDFYNLSDFMDEFNNQEFEFEGEPGETDDYWFTYIYELE